MAKTGIYTTLGDTAFGANAVSDGVAMLICPATAQTGTGGLAFELDTAYMVASYKEATNMGLTEEVNPNLLFNVREFFEKAGNGAKLWIVGYTPTAAGLTVFITDLLEEIIQSTVVANFDNRPRMLGFVGETDFITTSETTDPLVPEYIQTTAKAIQTMLENLFTESFRMVAILDGMMMNCAVEGGIVDEQLATRLLNLATLEAPRVAVLETTSTAGQSASVGQALGILSGVSIATSIGDMTLGSVDQNQYFLDANAGTLINTPVAKVNRVKCETLGTNQYLFTRTRPQKSGVYFNDGATCNDPANALSTIEYVRVGNAVCDTVEGFFVDLINTIVGSTTAGEVDPAYKAAMLDDLYDRYLLPRIRRGEAVAIDVDFWAKDGNLQVSRAIEVQVQITGSPTLREAFIETFFVSAS